MVEKGTTLNVDDMIIVSIDDHLIEPPDMFDGHVPERYRSQAPRLVRNGDGKDEWIFEDQVMGMVGLNAVVTWPKEEWGMNPSSLAEMRPGAYDIHERVRDMNRNGVLASMCFPSMAGFSGRTFQEAQDKDLSLVMLKAYNDWHIDEWCGAYPGRFIPLSILPLWDMAAVVDELKRVAAKGARAVTVPELPHLQGYPTYQSDWWDPFFTALCDLDLVMYLHIGQGLNAINLPDINFDEFMVLSTQVSVIAVQDLLWGPAFRKYPGLKVAFSEGGIGWIPFMLDRVDRHYENQTLDRTGLRLEETVGGIPRALPCVFHRRPHLPETPSGDRRGHPRLRDRLPALGFALAGRSRSTAGAVRGCGLFRRADRQDQLAECQPLLQMGPVLPHPSPRRHGWGPPGAVTGRRYVDRFPRGEAGAL